MHVSFYQDGKEEKDIRRKSTDDFFNRANHAYGLDIDGENETQDNLKIIQEFLLCFVDLQMTRVKWNMCSMTKRKEYSNHIGTQQDFLCNFS